VRNSACGDALPSKLLSRPLYAQLHFVNDLSGWMGQDFPGQWCWVGSSEGSKYTNVSFEQSTASRVFSA